LETQLLIAMEHQARKLEILSTEIKNIMDIKRIYPVSRYLTMD
jgi:hypothetical protein